MATITPIKGTPEPDDARPQPEPRPSTSASLPFGYTITPLPKGGGAITSSPSPAQGPDVVGRLAERAVSFVPGQTPKAIARTVLPHDVTDLWKLAVLGMGGELGLPALLGLGVGGTAALNALRGRDVLLPSLLSIPEIVAGKVGGAAVSGLLRGARAVAAKGTTVVSSLLKDIAEKVPVFAGATPVETMERIVTGEGMREAGIQFATRLKSLFDAHGNPAIVVPEVATLTGVQDKGVDTAFDMLTTLMSAGRRLKITPQGIQALEAAWQGFAKNLQDAGWPKTAVEELRNLRTEYGQAKAVMHWFGGPKAALRNLFTPAEKAALKIDPQTGLPSLDALQSLYTSYGSSLRLRALLGEASPEFERKLFRGGSRLGRDVPGRSLAESVGVHVYPGGASGYLRGLPRFPRLAGEGTLPISPEAAARAARVLTGQAAIGTARHSGLEAP